VEKENGRRSGVGGWGCGTQFGDKLVELGAVAIAEVEDFDAEQPAGADATDDALGPEAEVIDLEAEVELVAGDPAGDEARLDEAAIETDVENTTALERPAVDAEVDGTVARMTRISAAVIG
jgi:hypothetical protein